MHRLVRDIDAACVIRAQQHVAVVRANQADHHVERRRLARAVRTEQSDDFGGAHVQADVVHDGARPVALSQTLDIDLDRRACRCQIPYFPNVMVCSPLGPHTRTRCRSRSASARSPSMEFPRSSCACTAPSATRMCRLPSYSIEWATIDAPLALAARTPPLSETL